MQRALDSATGLPSRPVSALWIVAFLMPSDVRRSFIRSSFVLSSPCFGARPSIAGRRSVRRLLIALDQLDHGTALAAVLDGTSAAGAAEYRAEAGNRGAECVTWRRRVTNDNRRIVLVTICAEACESLQREAAPSRVALHFYLRHPVWQPHERMEASRDAGNSHVRRPATELGDETVPTLAVAHPRPAHLTVIAA